MNKTCLLAALALPGLMMQTAGATSAIHGPLRATADPQWTLVTAYSHSFFNHGHDSWQKESVDLYRYLAGPKVLLGAGVDFEQRSARRDDIVYSFNAEWYATDKLELHGEIELTDDADFLPGEQYSLGLKYRTNERLELHFDVKQMELSDQVASWDDGITQIRPGITWWFNENNRVTLSYTHGWVHNECDYDYYSAKFHFADIIRDGILSVGIAYGTDPDVSFGSGTTTLSDAYLLSIFYTEPVTEDLTVFFGVEYAYRMQPSSNSELYQMWTPTIGLSWKF